jgi:hypothetical protein
MFTRILLNTPVVRSAILHTVVLYNSRVGVRVYDEIARRLCICFERLLTYPCGIQQSTPLSIAIFLNST